MQRAWPNLLAQRGLFSLRASAFFDAITSAFDSQSALCDRSGNRQGRLSPLYDDIKVSKERLKIRPVGAEKNANIGKPKTPRKRSQHRISENFFTSIRATPAGREMNVRTIGKSLLIKTVVSPYLPNHACARSSLLLRINTYLPYRSRRGRPPYVPTE